MVLFLLHHGNLSVLTPDTLFSRSLHLTLQNILVVPSPAPHYSLIIIINKPEKLQATQKPVQSDLQTPFLSENLLTPTEHRHRRLLPDPFKILNHIDDYRVFFFLGEHPAFIMECMRSVWHIYDSVVVVSAIGIAAELLVREV